MASSISCFRHLESLTYTSTAIQPRARASILSAGCFQRVPLKFYEIDCRIGSFWVAKQEGRISLGAGLTERGGKNGLRALEVGSGGAGEDGDEGEDGEMDIADDALRETIKKSKEVLALQRDLLRQVLFTIRINFFLIALRKHILLLLRFFTGFSSSRWSAYCAWKCLIFSQWFLDVIILAHICFLVPLKFYVHY